MIQFMETILKLNQIHKSYGGKEVLKGVSLDVQKGEIISVLGPSGCGKSTLLNIIAGILPINEGQVLLNGVEVTSPGKMTPIEKRDLNMVFQDFALWPHMTARENILYGLKLRKTSKQEQEEKLQKMVDLLHLNGLMEQYPAELSGGQQQRVAIARALIMSPSIVLLDEPLCNLDVQLRIEMRTEMAQIFKELKTTVFHVTHDPSEAFAMADRIVVMDNGKIDQIATPEACYQRPSTAVVAGLLGAGNHISGSAVKTDGDYADVRISGALVKALNFAADGGSLSLYFRAEDAAYSDTETANSIPVQVVMPTFEGGTYRVKAKTQAGEEITFLHTSNLSKGQQGYLSIVPDQLYAYDKTGT